MVTAADKKGLFIRVSGDVEQLLDAESGRQQRSPTAIATEVLEEAVRSRSEAASYDELTPVSPAEIRAFHAEVREQLRYLAAALQVLHPDERAMLKELRQRLEARGGRGL